MNIQACVVWRNGTTCTVRADQLKMTDFRSHNNGTVCGGFGDNAPQ